MTTTDLTTTTPEGALAVRETSMQARRDLIRRQLLPGGSDLELEYFLETARELGLSPLSREIYAIMRNTRTQVNGKWETIPKMVIQIGIDGYRSVGARTGRFGGMRGPYWCGPDGEWKDVWLREEPPAAAKVEIVLTDTRETVTGIATWREFVQKTPARAAGKDPNTGRTWEARPESISEMWEKMGPHMLSKCAEAQAWRKALPSQTQSILSQARVEFAADPSPAPVTIHLQAGDDMGTFEGELRRAGWTDDDARREFATGDLAVEAQRRGGWAEMTMALRSIITKKMRDALLDESMPPGIDDERASTLLYGPDGTAATSNNADSGHTEAIPGASPPPESSAPSEAIIDGISVPGRQPDASDAEAEDIGACAFCGTGEDAVAFEEENGEAKPICQPCLDKRYAPVPAEPEPLGSATMPANVRTVGDFKLEAFRAFDLQPQQLKAKDVLGEDWEKKAKVSDLPALWAKVALHRGLPLSS